MKILVRQQTREVGEDIVIDEGALGCAVVGALMMLEAIEAQPFAQREQEVIALVMPSAEEGREFCRQALVGLQALGGYCQGGIAVGGDIDHVLWRRARREVKLLEVFGSDDWLVDQHLKRYWFELNLPVSRRRGGLLH